MPSPLNGACMAALESRLIVLVGVACASGAAFPTSGKLLFLNGVGAGGAPVKARLWRLCACMGAVTKASGGLRFLNGTGASGGGFASIVLVIAMKSKAGA